MMTENDPTTAPQPSTKPEKQNKRVVKKGKLAYSDNPEKCSHPIFSYLNEKRATQVCMHCRSRRRVRMNTEESTAVVGEWKAPQEKSNDNS
jgi:hypothetical protein